MARRVNLIYGDVFDMPSTSRSISSSWARGSLGCAQGRSQLLYIYNIVDLMTVTLSLVVWCL